jgi:hypothetical protein
MSLDGLPRFTAGLWPLLLGLGLLTAAAAQSTNVPSISFSLSFPGSQPDRYSIAIPLNGDASYTSDGQLVQGSDASDIKLTFVVSAPTRARIFELAKKAHYFSEDVDSKKKNLAFTGTKVLIYNDGQKESRASYNYSSVAPVQELTELFEDMSSTLEFGRRLEYYHRYQKLALDDELKRMEEMANQNQLHELAAVAPVLQQIADDNTVINPVRARAQRMLAKANSDSH